MTSSLVPFGSTVAALVLLSAPAAAGPLELGGLFGPRRFSEQSALGGSDNMETSLGTTVVFGLRIGKPVTSWLSFEGEVAMSPATTRSFDLGVFWIEPRAQIRIRLPGDRLFPFFLLGGGMPSAVSGDKAQDVYPSGVTAEGFGGAGVAFRPGRGIGLRLDFRVTIQPSRAGSDFGATAEGELAAGLWVELGGKKKAPVVTQVIAAAPVDSDGDGVVDTIDACPDRAEDKDGFEDTDGCPDIDNDGDLVLDIADKCPNDHETFNGQDDDDGCPDTVEADVDGIIGTVEGLNFAPASVEAAQTSMAAFDMVAEVLRRHPGVKLVIVGHTDDVEATDAAPKPPEGEPALDPELLATQLGQARAQAARDQLVKRGIAGNRLVVVSAGANEPVSDSSPRGRGRNRRVELKLFVPRRDH